MIGQMNAPLELHRATRTTRNGIKWRQIGRFHRFQEAVGKDLQPRFDEKWNNFLCHSFGDLQLFSSEVQKFSV